MEADMDMTMAMPMGGCKMSMYWNWNTVDACFFAEQWQVKSKGGFAGLCVGIILMTMLFECIRQLGPWYTKHITQAHGHRTTSRAIERASAGSAAEEGHALGGAASSGSPQNASARQPADGTPKEQPLVAHEASQLSNPPFRPSFGQHLVLALLHTMQFALAYVIMLMAMYYNGYIIICILIGTFLGYALVRWHDEMDPSSLQRPGSSSSTATGCH
ncbi:ctr copper transporter family protein-like protein [Apiospora marii]|uniref:Copper transport protein n=1 Tax=Apiospora marii TaxID=335849 RepID=A0ABR1R3V2_9PEZI